MRVHSPLSRAPIATPQLKHRPNFFSFMIQLPPKSTLFPYTTLFRSGPLLLAVAAYLLAQGANVLLMAEQASSLKLAKLDRKSTRLNSSHGYISYAVFCLKKKKENDTREARVGSTRTIACVV